MKHMVQSGSKLEAKCSLENLGMGKLSKQLEL